MDDDTKRIIEARREIVPIGGVIKDEALELLDELSEIQKKRLNERGWEKPIPNLDLPELEPK